ncbi:MAG: patatin-like phospholipase family protein [Hyphomonadaceae bacterium]
MSVAARWMAMIGAAALAGCVTPPRLDGGIPAPANAEPIGFDTPVRVNSDDPGVVADLPEALARLRQAADGSLDILALSGGGAGGAYGAGALVGLTRAGQRPQFEIVTGVSTGALIAPFAFAGPAWDAQLEEAYTGPDVEHLLQRRGLSALLRPGLYFGDPLRALVGRYVTPALIAAVNGECEKGKLLLVQTTNLDTEEAVIWDMCKIAASGTAVARDLFRNVLTASASMPGVFPPVMLDVMAHGEPLQEMHVDGGVTGAFFVMPQIVAQWGLHPTPELRGGAIYVIVNGQLDGRRAATPLNTLPIVARSFETNQMYQARAEIALTGEFAQRNHLSFQFTRIPIEYAFKGPLDFDHDTMRALFDFGMAQAQSGALWTTPANFVSQLGPHAEPSAQPSPP